jgi:hypothetical protein
LIGVRLSSMVLDLEPLLMLSRAQFSASWNILPTCAAIKPAVLKQWCCYIQRPTVLSAAKYPKSPPPRVPSEKPLRLKRAGYFYAAECIGFTLLMT